MARKFKPDVEVVLRVVAAWGLRFLKNHVMIGSNRNIIEHTG